MVVTPTARVAILCPGPSLPEVWAEWMAKDYACIFAVNTAGWYYTHHWFVGFDSRVFTPYFEKRDARVMTPLIGVLTNKPHRERALARGWHAEIPGAYYGIGLSQEQKDRCECEKCAFSFPNALREALLRFKGPVDVYGMDYAVEAQCVGRNEGDRSLRRFRSEARWLREFWESGRISVFGEASATLLAYVRGEREDWRP